MIQLMWSLPKTALLSKAVETNSEKLLKVSLRHQVTAKFGRSWNERVFMRCVFVDVCKCYPEG
jgi:hypothetical protein